MKVLNSTTLNDFLINTSVTALLYSKMLTFRGNKESFRLDGDLLETMTNSDSNVSHSNPQDRKLIHEFGKELNYNMKQKGRKSKRDKTLIELLKSPAIMASGISNTIFLPSDTDELCDRWKLLPQKKQAGNSSNSINEEFVAIVDKLLECKCK